MRKLRIVTCLVLLWHVSYVSCIYNSMLAEEIIKNITDEGIYSKRVRPDPSGTGGPINIFTNVYVYFIGSVDAQNLEFTIQQMVRHCWIDPRLNYSSIVFDDASRNVSHVVDDSFDHVEGETWLRDLVWTPTIYFVNERDKITEENVYVAIYPDGTVFYNYRVKMRIFCNMLLYKFPFDKQVCSVNMESWMYSVDDVMLRWQFGNDSVTVDAQASLPEYTLTKITTGIQNNSYPNSGRLVNTRQPAYEQFSSLMVYFYFSREVGHYIMDYYLPSILLVIMSWVSFWLDPNAVPGRVTLGTSIMLTFITLTRSTGSSLPKVSYIKVMEIWFIVCAAFIFGSLVEFAFVNTIWRRRSNVELKKVNSKYILRSTLTPKVTRRGSHVDEDKRPSNNADFLGFRIARSPSGSQQLTVSSMDSSFSGSNPRMSIASTNSDLEGETVLSLPVPVRRKSEDKVAYVSYTI